MPCRNAMHRKRKDDWARHKSGERLHLPAERGQAVVKELVKRNWTQTEIAAEAFMNSNTVNRILNGNRKWVHVETLASLEALLELPPRTKRHAGRVSTKLYVKAIRGLMAQGWSLTWIAEHVNTTRSSLSHYTSGRIKWVHPDIEKRMIDLVREVGSKEGPDNYARNRAAKNGWKPTMWVDDLV